MKKLLIVLGINILLLTTSLFAQGVVNPNNTIVRFAISTGGTNFGHIDVELFNEEKPETVKNFLLYVYSGAYSNLVINRLDNYSTYVVQAGFAALAGKPTANTFTSYEPTESYGPIQNEYHVGPERRNLFGTIAMARRSGLTNSASAEWYFNLRDNPVLDTLEGGYTVFGHVVNTSGTDTGTNLLQHFLGLPGAQIENLFLENFTSLPLSRPRGDVITMDELFVLDAFIIQNGRVPERNKPSFALTEPTENVFTTNSTFRFSGTASDDTELSRITFANENYRQDDIGLTLPGTANWSADYPLTPGTNRISVRSVDAFGNQSEPVGRTVFYSLKKPFTLQVAGPGKVTGLTNGQLAEVGVNYVLTARPAAGKYFSGWSGTFSSRSKKVIFRMTEGASVTARFDNTFLGLVKGKYDGLVFPNPEGPKGSIARIALNLTAGGVYHGQLSPLGINYSIRGTFDENGVSTITGRRGSSVLALTLRLVVDDDSQAILATYSDGRFVSQGGLFRVQKYSPTNPAPTAGTYTFMVTPSKDPTILAADGYGIGSFSVDARGKIKIEGALADGTSIKQTTSILKGDRVALFTPAYAGRGGLAGFGQIVSNAVINNVIRWFSPEFPGETNQVMSWSASSYVPPTQARLFNWTNGVVILSGNTLPEPVNIEVMLDEEGTFTIPSNPNNLQLTIPDEAGLFTGSFTHPVTQALTPLRGTVLQSSNLAAGFFGAGDNNGAVLIRAR